LKFPFLSRLAYGYTSWRGSEERLVEFRALNIKFISCVSLACPISFDVFIHATGSEESLAFAGVLTMCRSGRKAPSFGQYILDISNGVS